MDLGPFFIQCCCLINKVSVSFNSYPTTQQNHVKTNNKQFVETDFCSLFITGFQPHETADKKCQTSFTCLHHVRRNTLLLPQSALIQLLCMTTPVHSPLCNSITDPFSQFVNCHQCRSDSLLPPPVGKCN